MKKSIWSNYHFGGRLGEELVFEKNFRLLKMLQQDEKGIKFICAGHICLPVSAIGHSCKGMVRYG